MSPRTQPSAKDLGPHRCRHQLKFSPLARITARRQHFLHWPTLFIIHHHSLPPAHHRSNTLPPAYPRRSEISIVNQLSPVPAYHRRPCSSNHNRRCSAPAYLRRSCNHPPSRTALPAAECTCKHYQLSMFSTLSSLTCPHSSGFVNIGSTRTFTAALSTASIHISSQTCLLTSNSRLIASCHLDYNAWLSPQASST